MKTHGIPSPHRCYTTRHDRGEQSWALFPSKTVLENVAFGLKIAGVDKQERTDKVRHVLETVKMAQFENNNPSEFSGGQSQRIAFARSLGTDTIMVLTNGTCGFKNAFRTGKIHV